MKRSFFLLLICFFSSCATSFNKSKEYKEAKEKCILSSNYWERNDPAACEFLIKNLEESKKEASLYRAILRGSNCEKKLSLWLKSSKDQSITDSEFYKMQGEANLACTEFIFNIKKDDLYKSDYYWLAKGALNSTNTFCAISMKNIQTQFKKNKNYKSSSPICYVHISTLLDIAMSSESSESESTESFTKSSNLSSFLCSINDLDACKLEENIKSIKQMRTNAEAEKYAQMRADLEREKVAESDRNRIEKEKFSAEKEFNRQRSLCKQGDTNICWSLFVANKENQHGYEYLRDACILGHAQACQTKLIIDEETSTKNAANNEEIRVKKEKQQEFSKSMRCSGKNRPHSYDKSCDEECPRYQECLIKVNNLKQEEMLEKSNNRSKNIHCTPDGFGGFRCSEN